MNRLIHAELNLHEATYMYHSLFLLIAHVIRYPRGGKWLWESMTFFKKKAHISCYTHYLPTPKLLIAGAWFGSRRQQNTKIPHLDDSILARGAHAAGRLVQV